MADQELHYPDFTTYAGNLVKWLGHASDYGLLTETDMNGLTTRALLRTAVAAKAVPAITGDAETIQRQFLKVWDRAVLINAVTDADVLDAGDESSGSRIPKLRTLIAARTAPDTVPATSTATFAFQS